MALTLSLYISAEGDDMEFLLDLWLPIALSAVAVFFASFLAWAVLPHHKPDFHTFKEPDAVKDTVKSLGIPPGQYMFPCFGDDPVKMKDPAFKKAWMAGPHGVLHIWASPPNMGRNLSLTFLFFLVASIFVAYLSHLALGPADGFRRVFRVTGTAAVMAYAMAFIPNAIWFGRTLRSVVMDIVDGVAYGLLTGIIFGLLW
jgi:hypothetical protein